MNFNRLAEFSLFSLVLIGFIGCGTQNGDLIEKTVPAAGVLTYKGEPLPFQQVYFSLEGHRAATAITNEKGEFKLGTNQVGDGAVPGTHTFFTVYVGPEDTSEGANVDHFAPPPVPKTKIPRKYNRAETSEVTVNVPPGGSSELKIDLQ